MAFAMAGCTERAGDTVIHNVAFFPTVHAGKIKTLNCGDGPLRHSLYRHGALDYRTRRMNELICKAFKEFLIILELQFLIEISPSQCEE